MPQGSVLGPILYVVYMSPVADIIKSYGLSYRLYTDDSYTHYDTIYIVFSHNFHQQLLDAKDYIERCVADIQRWIQANDLKLNQDKTEIMLIYSKFKAYIDPPTIQIGDDTMFPQLPPTLANLISTGVAMIKSASPHSTSSGTLVRLEITLLILQQRVWAMNSLSLRWDIGIHSSMVPRNIF